MRCSKDEAFVNACCNSDRQNAYLEGAEAIRRIVTASDELQLTVCILICLPFMTNCIRNFWMRFILRWQQRQSLHTPKLRRQTLTQNRKKHEPEQNPDYQLLSRLKADCDYFLGAGGCAESICGQEASAHRLQKMRRFMKRFLQNRNG